MIVTIDGPAGSGKSTAAKGLAQRLGFRFLDTGAMYRAVTLLCQQRGVDLCDEPRVAEIAAEVQIRYEGDRVFANGREVTDAIRTSEVTQGTRFVAANTAVRKRLAELQRQAALGLDVVSEGRDQGTVVFPDAECKFFLTAAAQQRAVRRHHDLAQRGEHVPVDQLLAQQADRDRRDEIRTMGPLKPAADAIHIDTSALSPAVVLERLETIVREKMEQRGGSYKA